MSGVRVVILADDLIWSTRLLEDARSAGAEPVAVRTLAALAGAVRPDGLAEAAATIVDLTARGYDGIEAIAVAAEAGASVLAVGQHDDVALRKRALAAGASRVLAYRKLADDGPATIRAWLDGAATSARFSAEPADEPAHGPADEPTVRPTDPSMTEAPTR